MLKNNIYVKLLLLLLIPIITLIISYNGLGDGQTICLINNIFGIECIGCGMTKAIISQEPKRWIEESAARRQAKKKLR